MPVDHLYVFFGKVSIRLSCSVFDWVVCVFWYWVVGVVDQILDINPLSVTLFANTLSHSLGCVFILLVVSFAVHKLLSLIKFCLFTFAFTSFAFGDWSKKILLWFMSKSVPPMFSSRSCVGSGLSFWSVNLFWGFFFFFFYMMWGNVLTSLFNVSRSSFPSTTCWRDCLFSIVYSCLLCPRDFWTSLVVQWLRIHLPMQRTRVQFLVEELRSCHGATKAMSHNYWTCALEPACCSSWRLHALEPLLGHRRSCHSEKPTHHS